MLNFIDLVTIKFYILLLLIIFVADAAALGYILYLSLFMSEEKIEKEIEAPAPSEEDKKLMEFHFSLIEKNFLIQ